jgi:predicted phage terminase large subunit-like protein
MGKQKTPDPQSAAARAILLARSDLAVYCSLAWPRFEMAQHHRLVIEKLEAVERGDIERLMIFMPPRHGKSLIASTLFPPWYLGKHPDRSVLATSYGAELAGDFGRRVRNAVMDPLHRRVFPGCMPAPDSTAAHRFDLMNGGSYYATGSGGSVTGRGADLLLIDDPIKSDAQAYSAAERRSLQAWFEGVAYTRLQPGGAIVLIQTRWHQDDLAGWLLLEHVDDGWDVLSLPACAERDEGWRGEDGALWPKRFPLPKLAQIRAAIGGAAWQSLYQQRPAAAEGAVFSRDWWRSYGPADLPPRFESIILSLDTAFKVGSSNDYSVAVVLGVSTTGYFVLDLWRARVEFPELKRKVASLAERWRPTSVLIEDRASGQSLIQELRAETRLPVTPVKVDRDKLSRANAVTPIIESGRVYLPRSASWLADFMDELASFPAAPHDDMVDALTQALNSVRDTGSRYTIQYGDIFESLSRSPDGDDFPLYDDETGLDIVRVPPAGWRPRIDPKPEDGPGDFWDYLHERGLSAADPVAHQAWQWAKQAFEAARPATVSAEVVRS